MDTTRTDPTAPPVPAAPAAPAAAAPRAEEFGACDQCGAPVDDRQRYCVSCGARRKHVYDPAARYMATATSRSRSAARGPATARRRIAPGLGTAAVLVAIPLAVGLGVLVGRSGNGDDKLLAALRAQKPLVVTTGGGAAASAPAPAAASSTTAATLTSDFSLQSGYAVELQILPAKGTDPGSVTRAETRRRSRGASALGLITQADFRITPSPPHGAYVIYSGQFATRAAAEEALAKLKPRFPTAKVISVQAVAGAGSGGRVLNTTAYGSATQVTGYKPTPAAIAISRQAINKTAHEIGNNYVQAQKGLPDQTVLP
jgi:hypothetical protein